MVNLKELRSQLKVEESTLNEAAQQIPIMSVMLAQGSGYTSLYDPGSTSGVQSPFSQGSSSVSLQGFPPSSMSQMSSMTQMSHISPMPMQWYSQPQFPTLPIAYVS